MSNAKPKVFGLRIAAIVLMVVGAFGVYAWQRFRAAARPNATTTAYALQGYAVGWQRSHGNARCPTIEDIQSDNDLPSEAKTVVLDPWGSPYVIQCRDVQIVVSSLGPDRTPGTADDISVR